MDLNKGLLKPLIMDLLLSTDHLLAYFSDLLPHQHFNNKVTNDILRLLSPDTGHVGAHSAPHTMLSTAHFLTVCGIENYSNVQTAGWFKAFKVLHIIYHFTCHLHMFNVSYSPPLHCLGALVLYIPRVCIYSRVNS